MSQEESRWNGDPSRVAIVLPGIGYTPDMPLIYWTAKTLNWSGWTIQQVWWPHESRPAARLEWPSWVQRQAALALDRESRADQLLLVGKSLGTLAIPLAAERSLPGIWLTPLLANQAELRSALSGLPPSLLVGGTKDPTWDGAVARASHHTVCEIARADHSIEVAADPEASLEALKQVVDAVRAFAG